MKFITIFYNLLRNGEFLQLMKNVEQVMSEYDLSLLKLNTQAEAFSAAVKSMDDAFKPISGEELTTELSTLDSRRDKALIGIKLYLESCTYREDETLAEAARVVLDIYEAHGKRLDKLPYQQQTAITHALVKGIENQTAQKDELATLALDGWVSKLKELNTSFDNTYVNRAKTVSEPAAIDEKRNAIKEAFNNLAGDIEAYARIADNIEAYQPIIPAVNGLIEDYNRAAENRINGRSSVDETETAA